MLMVSKSSSKPELWGGIECSFNRVKDLYLDQLFYSGHYQRAVDDGTCIAGLGLKALRYPVIWERLHPRQGCDIDWANTVEPPLNALRALGVTPIAGLVHHGSGPAYAGPLCC